MHPAPVHRNEKAARWLGLGWAWLLVALGLLVSLGCSTLRLPKIDPTGQCIFAPYPENSTPLAVHDGSGCGCFSCLSGNGRGCLSSLFPEPAFTQPLAPPPCPPNGVAGGPAAPPPRLPAPGCAACADGPPAVLYGDECKHHSCLRLPEKGKRGCILLTPQRVVAPVGGEVILKSGICGDDGHLQMGEPLEWMLTPESNGHFIQVGDDDPGLLHRLAKIPRTDKRSGSYARGVTSTKSMLITRGNKNLRDDVPLEKGQTWISISSPTEGTSRVTVLAPESDCWDQRKATATIYWIDARWQFPGPQVLPAGTVATMATRVTRSEGTIPARGWKVRYEILNPDLAQFYDGSTVTEVVVDESGNATVQLQPLPNTSGTATVAITVIRPAGETENMPRMIIGRGQSLVTWSAPQLQLRVGAPQVATFDEPFQVVANVANPGDLAAENVKVTAELPPGVTATTNDAFGRVIGNQILWEVPRLEPQTQLDLMATVSARSPFDLRMQARADGGLFAEAIANINVFVPSLEISIRPDVDPDSRVQVGDDVRFLIDVTNVGDQPLKNLQLSASGDSSMTHLEKGRSQVFKNKEDGPLMPGDTWRPAVTFVPEAPGQRCVTVNATADGGQRAEAQSCVPVINRIPETPAVAARIESYESWQVGSTPIFRYSVTNTGRVVLENVRVTVAYDPQLRPLEATDGKDESEIGQYKLSWTIPQIPPGELVPLEIKFAAERPLQRGLMTLTVSSQQGATADDSFTFEIVPGPQQPSADTGPNTAPLGGTPGPAPTLPPTSEPNPPAPRSPSDQAEPAAPPIPADDGTLRLSLVSLDNPVRMEESMRYTLRVTNDRSVSDTNVRVRLALPTGTRIQGISQTMVPGNEGFTQSGDWIYLPEIRELRAGETATFTIELVSNQPQTVDLRVEVISRRHPSPNGVSVNATTRVLPR